MDGGQSGQPHVGAGAVLVIEDDAALRESWVATLEQSGYAVFAAADGEAGLRVLADVPWISVVLLDISMPVMDGWQVLRSMKADRFLAGIPIVAVSAELGIEESLALGAHAYLRKPASVPQLLEMIRACCHLRAEPQQASPP